MSSSFSSSYVFQKTPCQLYAESAIAAETQFYGPMSQSEFAQAYVFYNNSCVDAGGPQNMLDPVFIN